MTIEARASVILKSDPFPAINAVAEALAEIRGVPVVDTAREARSSWGLVAENQPPAEAAKLINALSARSVVAVTISGSAIPALPALQPADKLDIEPAGFRCRLSSGATTPLIPWAAVVLFAAAVVKSTVITKSTHREGPSSAEKWVKRGIMMTTGIPLPVGKSRDVETRKEETTLTGILDIGLLKPAGRLRLEAGDIDYSTLGEQRGYDSLGNFKLLVSAAAEHAPAGTRNHGVGVILSNSPISNMGYGSIEEFEREERWMLARRKLD